MNERRIRNRGLSLGWTGTRDSCQSKRIAELYAEFSTALVRETRHAVTDFLKHGLDGYDKAVGALLIKSQCLTAIAREGPVPSLPLIPQPELCHARAPCR